MPITTLKNDATGTRGECDTVIAKALEMIEEKLRRNNCQIVNISMGNVSKSFGGYRQLITVVWNGNALIESSYTVTGCSTLFGLKCNYIPRL